MTDAEQGAGHDAHPDADVVIVGAGFAGLYALHSLTRQGFRCRLVEAGSDVGGTWFWNRYPGARCDVESVDYSFSFDEELEQEWVWTQRYPAQPEILQYLSHVADRFDLRRHITFDTRVSALRWDDDRGVWRTTTSAGAGLVTRYVVLATGCLSVPLRPDLPGLGDFTGRVLHTGAWPTEPVDFTGHRVAVFGTGSSGIQLIPVVAAQAESVTVLQRTPSFSIPAMNRPLTPDQLAEIKFDYRTRRRAAREQDAGVPRDDNPQNAFDVDDATRRAEFEKRYVKGGFDLLGSFADLLVDEKANEAVSDFVRSKIRDIVRDPAVADRLMPTTYPLGTKRICVDTDYFATYNRANVELVDLRDTPLDTITADGIRTVAAEFEVDDIVLATGFDAMTGAVKRIDITGRSGRPLAEKWQSGPLTYLGLGTAGYPNLFFLAGSGSPSVLTNMVTSIEQHVEWLTDCLVHLREAGCTRIEATGDAEEQWVAHVNEVAALTLFPRAASWYMGANVPGKPRIFMPYVGGLNAYRQACDDVAADSYRGFAVT